MITRAAIIAILSLGSMFLPASSANAACSMVREEQMVAGQVRVYWVEHCAPSEAETSEAAGPLPPRDSDWDGACVRTALTLGLDPNRFCDVPPDADLPEVTPGLVLRALRTVDLPQAQLMIQPPKGRTLVNFETNFYTEQGEFTRTVTLLGRHVELRIWPASFRWRFGDGEVRETSSPGSAYPDLEITHSYRRKGQVAPSVDTTYAAEFRVDGGPWREVTGTVTIPGSPQSLRVVTARPVLVGG